MKQTLFDKVTHRHVILTLPDKLWPYIYKDRRLLDILTNQAKEALQDMVAVLQGKLPVCRIMFKLTRALQAYYTRRNKMKHLFFAGLLLFLANSLLTETTIEAATSQVEAPDIYLEEDSFNFGVVQEGEQARHKFTIRNKGNEELIIERVRTTCGCTSGMLGSKNVPPGGETKVELIYNSKGRPGEFSKTAYIHSNDPDEPEKKLVISGNVKRQPGPAEISLEESLDVGVIEVGKRNETELKITNTGGQNLIITEIKKGQLATTEDTPSTIAGGNSYNLKLSISPPKKGVLSDTITIISNAGHKEVKISGYAVEGSRGILISNWSKDSHQLRIKNEAFSKIRLLKIEGSASLSKEELGEGEEAILKITAPKKKEGAEVILKIAVPIN